MVRHGGFGNVRRPEWAMYGLVLASTAVAFAMPAFMHLSGNPDYSVVVRQMAGLAAAWTLFMFPENLFVRLFSTRTAFVLVLAATVSVGILCLARINPDAEIIPVYRSLFDALESGRNPYAEPLIYHRLADGTAAWGTFNYPPMEIFPYYLAYRLCGVWSSHVLTGTLIVMQVVAGVILLLTFPRHRRIVIPFLPALALFEVYTNSATSLLVVAALLMIIVRTEQCRTPWRDVLIAILFGLGLLTKFICIPIFAAWYWSRFEIRNGASWLKTAGGILIAFAVAAALMAQFGVFNVIDSTVLFNLELDKRAELTTYYPNILSALMIVGGFGPAYPIAAVVLLGISVLTVPKSLPPAAAFLFVTTVFVIVSPTPEPQYLPVFIMLVLAAKLHGVTRVVPVSV